jgi:hypothetical protein
MRRAFPLILLGLLLGAVFMGSPLRDSPNEKVIEDVKQRYKAAPWMKHVTDWGSTLAISVKTDYPLDDLDSFVQAYEICRAVRSAYAPRANDMPNLRIYGADTTMKVKIDGSREKETDRIVIAEATSLHDYKCGIVPPKELLKEAEEHAIPILD